MVNAIFGSASFRETAKDKCNLRRLGVTHVLNAAEGTWNNVDTGAGYYGDMDIVYHGVVAEDIPTFDLSQYFYSAAGFIKETLSDPQSKTHPGCKLSLYLTLVPAWICGCVFSPISTWTGDRKWLKFNSKTHTGEKKRQI